MKTRSWITNQHIFAFTSTLAAGGLMLAGMVVAQDWPQWRGPDRDGKVSGFVAPQTWPTNLTQKWKADVGVGDSSPVLMGNRLFTFGRVDANEVVRCLDAGNGTTNWESAYPAKHVVTGPPAGHPGPRSTPVIANGKICTFGVGGILSCFETANGHPLWRKESTNDYRARPMILTVRCPRSSWTGAASRMLAARPTERFSRSTWSPANPSGGSTPRPRHRRRRSC